MVSIFKIGEFSKLTQVSIRMLRYYDENGLLKPAQIDKFTGYRLYSVEQIQILNRIIFLRDTGFSVAEIAVALNNWDNDFIIEQLKLKHNEIEMNIQSEREKLIKIQTAITDKNQGNTSIHYNYSIKQIPSYQVISLRKIISNHYAEGWLWKELYAFSETEKINFSLNIPNFAIYHDAEFKDSDVDVEVCAPVNKMGEDKNGFVYREVESVETMACSMVYGAFENIAGAFFSFADWLQQHNQYKMTGISRQICHRGPWNEEDVEKYLTEIQIVVEKEK